MSIKNTSKKKSISSFLFIIASFIVGQVVVLSTYFFGIEASAGSSTFSDEGGCVDKSSAKDATAVRAACNRCLAKNDGRWGAVWVNNDPSYETRPQSVTTSFQYDDEDIYDDDGEADSHSNTTKYTAYLHGQTINCRSTTDTNPSSMNAHYVYFVDPKGNGLEADTGENYFDAKPESDLKTIAVSFITQLSTSTELIRSYNDSSVSSKAWSTTGPPTEIEIDLYKYGKYVQDRVTEYKNNNTADKYRFCGLSDSSDTKVSYCFIGVFRCPGSSSSIDSHCWANTSKLMIRTNIGLNKFNGQVKILDGDDFDNSAKNTYSNDVVYHGNVEDKGAGLVTPTMTHIYSGARGAGNAKFALYELNISNKQYKKMHVNTFLKVDGYGSSKYEIYAGNEQIVSGTDTPSNSDGHKILKYNICVKYDGKDSSGNAKFKFYHVPRGTKCSDGATDANAFKSDSILNNDTVCWTEKYQVDPNNNPTQYEYRTACIKAVSGITEDDPTIEGNIRFNAGLSEGSAIITATSPETGWDDASEKTYDLNVGAFEEDEKTVYVSYDFQSKTSLKKAKYSYSIQLCASAAGCSMETIKEITDDNQGCDISQFGSPGCTIYKYTGETGENGNNSKDAKSFLSDAVKVSLNTVSNFVIEQGGTATACAKLTLRVAKGDSVNRSYACINVTAPAPGDITGTSTVKVNSKPTGATIESGSSSVTATAKKVSSSSSSVNTETVVVKIENEDDKVTFDFSHKLVGDGFTKVEYEFCHDTNKTSCTKITDPNKPKPGSKTGNINGVYKTQISGVTESTNGRYKLGNGDIVCETLTFKVTNTGMPTSTYKSRACAEVVADVPEGDYCVEAYTTTNTEDAGTSQSRSYVKSGKHPIWSDQTIYVMPTDVVTFCHDYSPGAQSVKTTVNWPDIEDETDSNTPLKPDYPLAEPGETVVEYNNADGASSSNTFDYTQYSDLEEKNVIASTRTRYEANYPSGTGKHYIKENTNKFKVTTTYPFYSSSNIIGSIDINAGSYLTGTEGKTDSRKAESTGGYIRETAVGSEVSQAVTSYKGTVKAEERPEEWTWTYDYNCQGYDLVDPPASDDDDDADPPECTGTPEECMLVSFGSLASTIAGSVEAALENGTLEDGGKIRDYGDEDICTNGEGSGSHGSKWYRRDSTTSYTEQESSSIKALIPYNYDLETAITLNASKRIYAGETFTISSGTVKTKTKYNNATLGDYATYTKNTKTQLTIFTSKTDRGASQSATTRNGEVNGCNFYSASNTDANIQCSNEITMYNIYNAEGDIGGHTDNLFSGATYNAFDVPAGYYMCVGLSVYPYGTSDDGKDMGNGNGNNKTYFSKPSCQIVYKKPSFAVWGGSIYSNGNIVGTNSSKRNLLNYGVYSATSTIRRRMFSSWAEGLIVANGYITNVASGAATGYSNAGTADTGYIPIAAPGGIRSSDFCDLSRITVANSSCSMGIAGNAGLNNSTSIRDSIYERYVEPVTANTYKVNNNSVFLNQAASYTKVDNDRKRYTQVKDGALITGGGVPLDYGVTHIVYSPGSITIAGDLTYPDYFASANQLPQYIIYAKGDINIREGVTTINAVLISEGGKVNTCSNLTTSENGVLVSNGTTCNKQLKINGSIIADKIEFNRVYGGSVGSFTVEPAEIIDYNPSLYLWSSVESGKDISKDLTVTYTRELAPRQ